MKEEQRKKYVLFSPVGTHDPIGVITKKDDKPSEGSMLHIIRHYKPEIVYLYITKELNYPDNRYKEAIKKFHPSCEVIEILSEVDKDDANNYDAFMSDFKKYIKEIYGKYKGYEILLNISSGTPQMKSNLILEVITSNIKLIPVQVDTPTKEKNFEDKFDPDTLGRIDVEKEEANNRCKEPEILSFKRAKIQSQIESLIKNYEYSAAYNLFKDIDDISDLFNNELLKYLHHVYLRVNLKYAEANEVVKLPNNKDLTNNENELLEYYYVMKIKQKKGELSDFILRITPFITDLLFYYLRENVLALNKVLQNTEDGKRICIYASSDKGLIEHYENKFNNFKKKDDNFINLDRLLTIMKHYKNKSINNNLIDMFSTIREIEIKIRNNVAHRMVNITEEFISEKVGSSSKEIMGKNEALLKKVIPKIDTNYFLYDEINQKIIDLLQEHK